MNTTEKKLWKAFAVAAVGALLSILTHEVNVLLAVPTPIIAFIIIKDFNIMEGILGENKEQKEPQEPRTIIPLILYYVLLIITVYICRGW